MRISQAVILMAALLAFHTATSQPTVWKKKVVREIVLPANSSTDQSLAETLVKAIKAGSIKAYTNFDYDFSMACSPRHLGELLEPVPDTIVVVDPLTGQENTVVHNHPYDYKKIHSYRLLEEWQFDPVAGKTDIRITGIAPVRDVYGHDGSYRGKQSVFWLHYKDAQPYIARYDAHYPKDALSPLIWMDYFEQRSKATNTVHLANNKDKSVQFKAAVMRMVDLTPPEDSVSGHLFDINEDSCLAALIDADLSSGRIGIDSARFDWEHFRISQYPDTIPVIDPITGAETLMVRWHRSNYEQFHNYGVLEQWAFNPETGHTITQITDLGFMFKETMGDDTVERWVPHIWFHYSDVRKDIAKYEQYHPTQTIAGQIWDDYFYGAVKPEEFK